MPSIRGAVSTLSPVRLPFGLSCSLHLPFRLSCSLHLPFGWSCSLLLPFGWSCSLLLPFRLSCSLHLPFGWSCSLLLPFGWSCSLLLPFRSSCTLYLPETCRSLPATPLMRSLARKDTPERGAMSSIPPPPPERGVLVSYPPYLPDAPQPPSRESPGRAGKDPDFHKTYLVANMHSSIMSDRWNMP